MRKQVRATHSVISALLLGALQLVVMLPAFAAREFKAGEAVTLAEGNGLLVVLLNSLEPLEFVSLDRRNATFGGEKLMTFSAGRSLRLVELPAGEYQWAKATFKTPSAFTSTYITMRKDPALAFKIEPGVINYSGDLDLDGTVFSGWFRTERNNRLAAALLQLEREFPNLRKQYPLRWQGSSPDRYIDLLDKQRQPQYPAGHLAGHAPRGRRLAPDAVQGAGRRAVRAGSGGPHPDESIRFDAGGFRIA